MEDLDDTVELEQVQEDFQAQNNAFLSRCTSTPLVIKGVSKISDDFLFTPPPNVISADSGFESISDCSSAEKSKNNGSSPSQTKSQLVPMFYFRKTHNADCCTLLTHHESLTNQTEIRRNKTEKKFTFRRIIWTKD